MLEEMRLGMDKDQSAVATRSRRMVARAGGVSTVTRWSGGAVVQRKEGGTQSNEGEQRMGGERVSDG